MHPRLSTELEASLRRRSNLTVLDAATGAGGLTRLLAGVMRGRGKLISVDIDPAPQAMARRTLEAAGFRTVSWLTADLSALPIPDGDVDIVVSGFTISCVHASAPFRTGAALSELARVLKPGGLLCIVDYLPQGGPLSRAEELADEVWRLYKACCELRGEGHYIEYPAGWVAERVRQVGLEVDQVCLDERRARLGEAGLREFLARDWVGAVPDDGLRRALQRREAELRAEVRQHGLSDWSGTYTLFARKPSG